MLVLGGTHHVGRAVVEVALQRGDDVTTLNRGLTGVRSAGARELRADRTEPGQLAAALGDQTWDAVIDTWSLAPRVVKESAELLRDRVGHYGYVSSRSVYGWPIPAGLDESCPTVDARSDDESSDDYATAKRGSELAVIEAFDNRALIARAGLILGPYEDSGRLVWWLRRVERAGDVLAPGPKSRPLQLIDARDLAQWMLAGADRHLAGVFNTVSKPGHTTMGELLESCIDVVASNARLVWVEPAVIEQAGIEPWTELPIWLPPTGEAVGLHDGDVSAAFAQGLFCRRIADTVASTWEWLQLEGDPESDGSDADPGLDAVREAEVLAGLS